MAICRRTFFYDPLVGEGADIVVDAGAAARQPPS
jgi:hypothetical protein